jgi:hypothetical protein
MLDYRHSPNKDQHELRRERGAGYEAYVRRPAPAALANADRRIRRRRLRNFPGPVVQGFFGPVQAKLTVSSGKMTQVSITAPQDNPTSAYINSQAVPLLRSETLQAQSANINGISGATVTSDAYYQSLLGALKAAHLA